MRQAEHAADQQDEGKDRQSTRKNRMAFSPLRGTRGMSSGTRSATNSDGDQDRPPALFDRVAAEHELAELGVDEGPAGTGPAVRLDTALRHRGTDRAVGAGPLRR